MNTQDLSEFLVKNYIANCKERGYKMGCDIHIFLEVKHKNKWTHDNKWTYVQEMDTYNGEWQPDPGQRNYEWFGYVADGVRCISSRNDQKGWPDDMSDTCIRLLDKEYYHSHTWYTAKKFNKLYQKFFETGKSLSFVYGEDLKNIRVLIAFDS